MPKNEAGSVEYISRLHVETKTIAEPDYCGTKKIPLIVCLMIGLLFLAGIPSLAQDTYYYHTIHSHGLSVIGGRTVKANYLHQMSHNRQFKLSTLYIYDSFTKDRNQIKSNIYNLNLHFQYILMNQGKFFLNGALGAGTYYLTAKDLLDIKLNEWHVDFVVGVQAEFYIVKNTFSLTFDYDILYMPWSKIYEFLHLPNVGLTFYFF
jgi:hypothetical protein